MKWKIHSFESSWYYEYLYKYPDQNHIICLVILNLNAMRSEVLYLANYHLFIYVNYTTPVIANAH